MSSSIEHIAQTGNGSSEMIASFLINQLRPQIEKEIRSEHENEIRELKNKIQNLEHEKEFLIRERERNQNIGTTTTTQSNTRKYTYNSALFPQNQGNIIIDALVKLADTKREGGKYVIENKSDWFFAYKFLYRKRLFFGSQQDFCILVNECVIPYLELMRAKRIKVQISNFATIPPESTVKEVQVDFWRQKYIEEKQKQIEDNKQSNTKYLERALNTVDALQLLLSKQIDGYTMLQIL